jgi:AcrR family transcriptional regulator
VTWLDRLEVAGRTGEAEPVVRRAPFSDNPRVGARGQRTRQRILDAALQLFGTEGYHGCSVAGISKHAGCSRVSFYQYFPSKEDLFRQLAGQVARQVSASTEALDPLTPDAAGWSGLRSWLGRYGDTHERYGPIFKALPSAVERDEALATASVRLGEESVARVRSKLSTTDLPPRQLDALLALLLASVTRSLDDAVILRSVAPDAYSRDRVEDAITDVMHRALFGRHPANVRAVGRSDPPSVPFGPVIREMLQQEDTITSGAGKGAALDRLVEAGRDVFVGRGYHGTRVDDLVAAAGVSHGVFYRYFENKEQLATVLTVRAMRAVSAAFVDITEPGTHDAPALRRWLRRYNTAQASEAAMIRVWVDAALEDARLRAVSASALDWGRRRVLRLLSGRGFGDAPMEAVVMVALLGSFGTQHRGPATVEAAAHVLERGLLGR